MSTFTDVPPCPNVSPSPNVLPPLDTTSPLTMAQVEPSAEQTTPEPEPTPVTEAPPQNTPDVSSNPQPARRPRGPPPLLPAVRPLPTHAFGFLIPEECGERYAKQIVALKTDFTPGTKEYESAIRCMTNYSLMTLPAYIHEKISTLPVPHPRALLARGTTDFVYPIADNGCKEAYYARISMRDMQLLREELGLPRTRKPRWFRVEVL